MFFKADIQTQRSEKTTGLTGHFHYSFKQDIYSEVLVIPDFISAGNVSQNTTYSVVLWNATQDVQNLSNVSEIGTQGILLNGPAAGRMEPNQAFYYDVEVTTQGPAAIDAEYSFNLQGADSKTLEIIGSRVVVFDFAINWAALPKESFQHYTDVRVSYDGTEFRHNLTEVPRFMMQYYYTLTDAERMRLDGLLYAWADKIFLVPVFSQLTHTTSLAVAGATSVEINIENTDMQQGMSVLFGKDQKTGQILKIKQIINNVVTFETAFEKDWAVGSFVTPLVQAYINSESRTSHDTDNITNMTATFEIKDNTMLTITNSIDGFEEYDGLKLLTQEPNRKIVIERAYARLVDTVDYGSGIRARVSKDKKPAVVFNYTFDCIGKDEINKIKAFFNNMKGMTDEFLVSTFTNDIKVEKAVSVGESTIVIENTGVGTYYLNNEQKNLICFYFRDGTKAIRKVVNVIFDTETTERLIIDKPFDKSYSPSDFNSVQFLSNARFNSDTIEFEYETDEYARATTEIRILRG